LALKNLFLQGEKMNLKRYWIGAGSSSGKGGAGIRTQSEFKKTSGSSITSSSVVL